MIRIQARLAYKYDLVGNNNFISVHSYDKVADIGDDNQLLGME